MTCSGKLRNMASVYLLRDGQILLLHRKSGIAGGTWIASAGGHFEQSEVCDARACALRELEEELGLTIDALQNLSLRYVTLRRTKDELRQNYYFFANLKDHVPSTLPSTEGITKWVNLKQASDYKMPFTAQYVVDHYIRVGQFDQHLYGGIGNDAGVNFIIL